MHTEKCPECSKSFTKPTKAQADQAVRMHVGRAHKKNIQPGHGSSRLPVVAGASNGQVVVTDRRTKAWRAANPELAAPLGRGRRRSSPVEVMAEPTVCFCPRCGLDIARVTIGMHLATRMRS